MPRDPGSDPMPPPNGALPLGSACSPDSVAWPPAAGGGKEETWKCTTLLPPGPLPASPIAMLTRWTLSLPMHLNR